MKKEFFVAILALSMAFTLTACGGGAPMLTEPQPTTSPGKETASPINQELNESSLRPFESYFSDGGNTFNIVALLGDCGYEVWYISANAQTESGMPIDDIESVDLNDTIYKCNMRFSRRIVYDEQFPFIYKAVFSVGLNVGITSSADDYTTQAGKKLDRKNMGIDYFQIEMADKDALTGLYERLSGFVSPPYDEDTRLIQLVGPDGRPDEIPVSQHIRGEGWVDHPMYLKNEDRLVMEWYKLRGLYDLLTQMMKRNANWDYAQLKASFGDIPLEYKGLYKVYVSEVSLGMYSNEDGKDHYAQEDILYSDEYSVNIEGVILR